MILIDREKFASWLDDMAQEADAVFNESGAIEDKHISKAIRQVAWALRQGSWDLNTGNIMYRVLRNEIVQYCEEHAQELGHSVTEEEYDLMTIFAGKHLGLREAIQDAVASGIEQYAEIVEAHVESE